MRFEFGGYQLDDDRVTLTGPDGPVHLEPQVFDVLHFLLVNRDRVVPKEELLDSVWGDRFVSESALTTRLKAARRAVGDDGRAQRVIRTVHGKGYHFVAVVTVDEDLELAPDRGRRDSLPAARTTLIGRDADLAGLATLVREGRVVTVLGPGGVGKTTLALAACRRVSDEFDDGVVFVDLAPTRSLADVTRACAEAAGVQGRAAGALDELVRLLAHRRVLLVLDNCEHVLDSVADLADRLLDHGGEAHLLATSREPLGVAGEQLWPLAPLGDEAPELFVARARQSEPRVTWDPEDRRIVGLCRDLDGLPLALELAAGQLRRFDLEELRRRLDGRLTLLARPRRSGERRHDTMETTIDWSYQLLDLGEQRLLRRLGVFPASFRLGDVEAMEPLLPRLDLAATLAGLVDKSLVVLDPVTGRYRLLETIRAFSTGRLEDAREADETAEWHRSHVLGWVSASSRLDRWMSASLAAAYRTELDHVRQAFRHSVDQGAGRDALEIALGASFLWRNALGSTEGRTWVDDLLDLGPESADRLWTEILRADVGQGLGDHLLMFDAAAAAAELVGDADRAGHCITSHFGALANLTEPGRAHTRLAPVLELAVAANDQRLVTLIEAFMVVVELADREYGAARAHLERIHGAASSDGYDRFITHWTGWMLGLAERDHHTADYWIGEQQEFLDRTGIVETWISSFSMAFNDAIRGGDVHGSLRRALALAEREGYRVEPDCVLALAYAELAAGRYDEAARLLGTAIGGRFNSTAHYVLYRVVIDTPLRSEVPADVLAAEIEAGLERTPAAVLADHGIGAWADPLRSAGGRDGKGRVS